MKVVLGSFLGAFLISFSASAAPSETQCFQLFSYSYEAFQMSLADGHLFKAPAYETFLRLYDRQMDLFMRLPEDMHPQLKQMAMAVVSDYEQALPFVLKIYEEIYDPKDPVTLQTVGTYYHELLEAKIVGANVANFEQLTNGSVEAGMKYLNEDGMIIYGITTLGIH